MYTITYSVSSKCSKMYQSSLNNLIRVYFFFKDIIGFFNKKPEIKNRSADNNNNNNNNNNSTDTSTSIPESLSLTNPISISTTQINEKALAIPHTTLDLATLNKRNSYTNDTDKTSITYLLDRNKKDIENKIIKLNYKLNNFYKDIQDVITKQSSELKFMDNSINNKLNKYDITNKILSIENEVLCVTHKMNLYTYATFVCCCLFLLLIVVNSYYISDKRERRNPKYYKL